MRFFRDFPEALKEIKRDFKEMGIEVQNHYHEDKHNNDDRYFTIELLNYGYTIVEPKLDDFDTHDHYFASAEWNDRVSGIWGNPLNPGTSYYDSPELKSFLELGGNPSDGETDVEELAEKTNDVALFSYTYSERLAIRCQVFHIIRELRRNPTSRQLYISIWSPDQDAERIGRRRVPGTLGYHFVERSGRVHLTHLMRSCEFGTHFSNDVWLAIQLLHFICGQTGKTPGRYSHFINSFHVYKKNFATML